MCEGEEMEFKRMIIAMKGDACTGKTLCAIAIGMYYGCSVIHYDDILDSLCPSRPSSREEANRISDVAFDVVCRLVSLQLEVGRPVVVDSPLVRRIHRHRLLHIAEKFQHCRDSDCHNSHSRFLIVECQKLKNWRRCFELNRGSLDSTGKWYKPVNWGGVRQSLSVKDYPPGYLPTFVSTLIVDTSMEFNALELGNATLELCLSPDKGRLIHFWKWVYDKENNLVDPEGNTVESLKEEGTSNIDATGVELCLGKAHLFELVTGELQQPGSICKVCREDISSSSLPAYVCKRCKLSLHQPCAETEMQLSLLCSPFAPLCGRYQVPELSDCCIPEDYKYKCSSCKDFSSDCDLCLWEMHFRSRLVPTIIRPYESPSMDVFYTFFIASAKYTGAMLTCEACKLLVGYAAYLYVGQNRRYVLHTECVFLPNTATCNQGNRDYEVNLVYGEQDDGEYICDSCLTDRDPLAWYYHCEEYNSNYHVQCMNFT